MWSNRNIGCEPVDSKARADGTYVKIGGDWLRRSELTVCFNLCPDFP